LARRIALATGPSTRVLLLRHEITIDIANLDRTKISVLQSRLDLRAVARRNDDELVRMQVFLRHASDIVGGYCAIALRKLRVVVERAIVEEDGLHRSGCSGRRLEDTGQRLHQRV